MATDPQYRHFEIFGIRGLALRFLEFFDSERVNFHGAPWGVGTELFYAFCFDAHLDYMQADTLRRYLEQKGIL